MKKSHFTPAEFGGYIPHRPPMLMIDEVIFADPELESGEAFYVPGNRPMAGLNPDGSLPSHVIMEVMAQGCAAVLGVCRMLRGEPPPLPQPGLLRTAGPQMTAGLCMTTGKSWPPDGFP